MSSKREKYLETQIRKHLNSCGCIEFKSDRLGMPDIIALCKSKLYLIEVKRKGLKPKIHQKLMIEKLNSFEYAKSFYVDNFEDFLKEFGED